LTLPLPTAGECWRKRQGAGEKPLSTIDALLAATAVQYNLTMVTRNDAHFSSLPVSVLNPWQP